MEKVQDLFFHRAETASIFAHGTHDMGVILARICLLFQRGCWAQGGCFAAHPQPSWLPLFSESAECSKGACRDLPSPTRRWLPLTFSRSHCLRICRQPHGRRISSRSSPTEMEFRRMMIFRNLDAIGVIALVRSPKTLSVTPTRGLWCPSKYARK